MQRQLATGLTPGKLNDTRTAFRSAVSGLNDFHVESVRNVSATAAMTEALTKNEVSIVRAYKSRKMFNDILREQLALQKATTVQWSQNAMGQTRADMIVPRGVTGNTDALARSFGANLKALNPLKMRTVEFGEAARVMSTRIALTTQTLASSSHMMINWGKNVQWAGRQLMVGFTVPFLAFGVAAGAAAYQVDQQLTRITKVYDTTAKTAAGKQSELDRLRADSMDMASQAAKRYGVAMKDTLGVEAELAAAGAQGKDLTSGTAEIMRASTLGELDYQQTVKASIALQSIYKYNTTELGDAFNYMNALENATNLSMQDMVDTIPRASGTLAQMGVSLKQTGVLMAAMKAAGIEAAQGANALKSGMNRVLNPGDKVKKQLADIGINIGQVVKESGGNLYMIIENLATQMRGLDKVTKGKAIGALFGTMQMNRITAIINAMGDVKDTTTQVGRAYQVANQGAEAWGATAATEMSRIQASASGKFKRALETIKAGLAEAGKPFLEIASSVLGKISGIVSAFNGLSGGAKRTIAAIMLVGAVAGPLIMIGGLIANMFGHLMKVGVAMGNLMSRTRIMTAEQRAQQMMSERSALAWTNQANAAQALSGQLQILTRNLTNVALAQHNQATGQALTAAQFTSSQAAASQMGLVMASNGRYRNANGSAMSVQQAQQFAALQASAAASSSTTAANAARTGRSMTAMLPAVAGVALLGSSMMTASGHAGGMLNTMMNIALTAAMVGPLLVSGFRKAAAAGALADIATAFGNGRRAGSIAGRGGVGQIASGLSAAVAPARVLLMTFLRFAGIVGVIASVGFVIYKMVNTMNQMKKAQEEINTSAQGWADVLGYVYSEAKAIEKVNGKVVNNYDVMADGIRKSKPGLAEMLHDLGQAENKQKLINAAIHEGVKARQTGASAAAAYNVVAASLRTGGMKTSDIENLMPKIKLQVDFAVDKSVLAAQAKGFADDFAKIANNTAGGQSKWEGFSRMFSGRDEINNSAASAARGMAAEFWNAFEGTTDQSKRLKIFTGLESAISKQQKEMWARLGKENQKELAEVGITTAEELQKAYYDAYHLNEIDFNDKYGGGAQANKLKQELMSGLGDDTSKMVGKQAGAERELAQAIARKNGASDEDIKNIYTLNDMMGKLNMATMTSAQAQEGYGRAMMNASYHMDGMSKKEKEAMTLKILNQYRAAAGLSKATSTEQGFGDALHDSTGKLKANSDALSENAMSADDFNNAKKDAMTSASSSAFSAADEIWNKQADAQVQAIEDRGSRLSDALDKRSEKMDDSFDARQENAENRFDKREKAMDKKWDNTMDRFDARWDKRIAKEKAAYDKKIENIQKAIKAEEDAEATRQKIFEAEKTRIERMADIANKRIDFNMALNTGNLDEAAKVFNDIQSTQDSYTLDDAAGQSSDASQQKVDGMNGKITTLEDARDKRIETLQKVEEAEKKALEAKKQREQEALTAEKDRYMKSLAAERERYRKGVEAQKAFIQEQTKRDADAKRAELVREKKVLDMRLAELRASIPKNKKEYDAQIKAIEKAYRGHGVKLEDYTSDWADFVGKYLTSSIKTSANQIQSDIKWKSIGNAVTQDMVDGGFNMTTAEFMKWVTTGSLPKSYKAPSKPKTRHTGGPVSGNSKYDNRGGRNWGTGMRRDESMMLLKNDEFVVNGKAHKALGTDALDGLNKNGALPAANTGGRGLGFAGAFAAAISGMASKALQTAVETKGAQASAMDVMAIPGAAGLYGKIMLSGEQLANAATIMSVGKSMGGTTRDLIIGIMTAMQESGLRNLNYGDRDSLGLFQQRPSMGWGTAEQIRTPSYAAKKFFQQELKVKGREKMAPTLVAQAVQRSGYPLAYAKWEDMARAIVSGTAFQGNGFSNTNQTGWRKPLSSYRVSQEWNSHHGGIDLAAPTGSAVYAANAGTVVTSADLHGSNPYNNSPYRSYGRYVVIDHGGQSTLYAHLSQRYAQAGQKVGAGARIGLSGSTGNSTGPHLHFETRGPGGFPGFNPKSLIPGLKTGGFTMNDGLAMLHKNEVVLTAPLTEQLKSGIEKIDQGSTNSYNVNVTFTGPVNSEIDVEKAVTRAIQKRESKLGRKRSIGN